MVNDHATQNVQFIIERHGVTQRPADVSQSFFVSSHWIRFCLEVNMILILHLVKFRCSFLYRSIYFILHKLILHFLIKLYYSFLFSLISFIFIYLFGIYLFLSSNNKNCIKTRESKTIDNKEKPKQ